MVTNLFSIFDPSGLTYSANWLSLFIPLGLLFTSYYLISYSVSYTYSIVSLSLKSELDLSLAHMGYSLYMYIPLTSLSHLTLSSVLLFPLPRVTLSLSGTIVPVYRGSPTYWLLYIGVVFLVVLDGSLGSLSILP
jgi:hypothetical protein